MYPKGYDPDSFRSNPGERFKTEYIGEEDEYGFIQLVEVGKTDLVELHNRDADLNNVNVLYQRFCNGDISALSQVQGSFIDAIGLPRDLRGMHDLMNEMQTAYDNMPQDVRQRYTFEQFLENAGSEQWIKDFVKEPSSKEQIDDNNTTE